VATAELVRLDRLVGIMATAELARLDHLVGIVELDHLAHLVGIAEHARLRPAGAQVLNQEAKVQRVKGKHYDID